MTNPLSLRSTAMVFVTISAFLILQSFGIHGNTAIPTAHADDPVCGNGITESGETCDDGNTVGEDGCSAICQVEPVCGNSITESGETCDDGNTVDLDGCSSICQIEGSSSSSTSQSSSWGCEWSSSSSSSSSSSCEGECSSSSESPPPPASSQGGDTPGGHGSHLGNDTTSRLRGIINFISGGGHAGFPSGAFGGGVSGPFTAEEKAKICAVKQSKFISDIHIVAAKLAELLAEVLGRPDTSPIVEALEDPNFCPAPETVSLIESQNMIAIRVNADGFLVTSNPVVNACMRGKATLGLIHHNTDKVMHRQGAIITYRPRTCSDYHHGSDNVWLHPDYLSLHVALNDKGQLKEDALPKGVLVMRDAGPGFVTVGNVASK